MFVIKVGFYVTGFWLFPGVLEGLGSSGSLLGTSSTYPGTYKCPGSRVMAKNPPGDFFYRVRPVAPQTRKIDNNNIIDDNDNAKLNAVRFSMLLHVGWLILYIGCLIHGFS